ncbi:hypothetical protein ACFL5Z_00355 [Planctomycetota bacterium]
MACQNQKDLYGGTARLYTTQRSMHQLRGMLQAAERLPLPQVQI